MDLKDMILVTENDRGTETNMLMTLDDYKSFITVDDMSELADNLLQLGRTLGEAGNFPAAIKVTAEYFPKKDRAFSTAIFNAGSTVGALAAPISIPPLARYFQQLGIGNGWEMAFVVIGGLGFIWMGLWMFLYKKPHANPHVNAAELAYIEQDNNDPEANKAEAQSANSDFDNQKISFLQCFKFPQTLSLIHI